MKRRRREVDRKRKEIRYMRYIFNIYIRIETLDFEIYETC